PHTSLDEQSGRQPSPSTLLPSSHTSPLAVSTMLSPHRRGTQFGRHAAFGAFELAAPLSHCSLKSRTASPHFGSVQLLWHWSLLTMLASSHCSPFAVSTMPLPHTSSDLQSPAQPSPLVLLPSSQTSPLAVSRMPSPQRASVQLVRQVAF